MTDNKNKSGKKSRLIDELCSFIETAFITSFVLTLVFTYIFKVTTVEGDSMESTLFNGDTLIASLFYSEPQAGDIVIIDAEESVIFKNADELKHGEGLGKHIVKRIIATEGQTVDIDFVSGSVYVDGAMLSEEYVSAPTHLDEGAFSGMYPITVPEGYVFVLGDNRPVSKDSRSSEIGFVSEENIIGKVLFRMFPLDEIGFVD